MKRLITLLMGLLVSLSACGTLEISVDRTATPDLSTTATVGELKAQNAQLATQNATLNPKTGLLTMDSASETIRLKMEMSSTFYQTIFVDGTVTWYAPDGQTTPPEVYHEQDWIEPANHRFRVLLGPGDGAAAQFKACNGSTILEMDLATGQSQSRELPKFARDRAPAPRQNILWGQIGTPLTEVVLADNYAGISGTFVPVKLEPIAERSTLVVDWTRTDATQPAFRAWVDVEMGVILKFQEFGKGGGTTMLGERVVNQVIYDFDFVETLFGSPTSLPQFSDVNGQPLVSQGSTPTNTRQPVSLGEVYFFTFDSSHGMGTEIIHLNRLPGSCVFGNNACPQAEVVNTPFSLNFSLTPLIWSPDGKLAAFAVPGSQTGDKTDLFIFDPAQDTWTSLAKFEVIDYPMWSEDGNWIAFRVQDGLGNQDIYAIRRDGTGLINLTGSGKLPAEKRPYSLEGWLSSKVMLLAGTAGTQANAYLVDPHTGTAGLISETLVQISQAFPSPDGASFVAINYPGNGPRLLLKLIDAQGNALQDLMAFGDGNIGWVTWSSDANEMAFSHNTNSPYSPDSQNVYVIKLDGTGMKQVYTGTSIPVQDVAFSPDGKALLFQADDATGTHIFVVDLGSLQQHILQAPDLQLNWRWLAPSWQP